MAGKLTFTLEQFKEAATQYRPELLMIPILGIDDTLKYMTSRPGVQYKEAVGTITGDAQFAPYKAGMSNDFNLNLTHRILETYLGATVQKFEPNSAISTLYGSNVTKGDGQKSTPTAKHVLALVGRALSENLNSSIWNAVRNATGTTTKDLFNGFDTIAKTEITAGNLSAEKGNYLKLTEEITKANAVDVAKSILFGLDPKLRSQECYLYCSYDFYDKYNEGYLLTHGAVPYNNQYGQTAVEGSAGKLILCPLANKAGSKYMQVTPKSNMLVGFDQMGDVENVNVEKYESFVLTYEATMFFGVQYESIAKEDLKVIELAD